MWKRGSLLVVVFWISGCGLAPSPDVIKPKPSPDTPDVNVTLPNIPSQAYWQAYAVWVEKGFIKTPQALAQNAQQLHLVKLLSDDDFKKLGDAFPGALTNTTPLVKSDSDKLRAMK